MTEKKKDTTEQDLERAANAIWDAEFLLVIAGPNFDEGARNPFNSEYCDPQLVSKPNKLMGFWGSFFNEYTERTPHEGFFVLSKWREKFFCQDDVRKRQVKKRPEEEEVPQIARFAVFTPLVSNLFFKAQIPQEEICEPCGNVFWWQCSSVPPCSSKVTYWDGKTFRFVIDDNTHEAMPVKYVSDRRDTKTAEEMEVIYSDEEDAKFLSGKVFDDVEGKLQLDEKLRRQARRAQRSGLNRIGVNLQVIEDRFPDLFRHFATTQKSGVQTYTFPEPKDDEFVDNGVSIPPQTHEDVDAEQQVAPLVAPPRRCSHLLAHVQALDLNAFPHPVGSFALLDPHKWSKQRQSFYEALGAGKVHYFDSGKVAPERRRTIQYNVSIIFQDVAVLDRHQQLLKQQQSSANPEATQGQHFCREILSSSLRSLLFSVFPNTAEGQMEKAAAVEQLQKEFHSAWGDQGHHGIYYFSHVHATDTQEEPVQHKQYDIINIPFPTDGVQLPNEVKVSVVCETVVEEDPKSLAALEKERLKYYPNPPTPVNPNPYSYTRHVWQMVGNLRVEAKPPKLSEKELQEKLDRDPKKEMAEYILETNQRYDLCPVKMPDCPLVQTYVAKIGVSRSAPGKIAYIELEVPNCEKEPYSNPMYPVRCREEKSVASALAERVGTAAHSFAPTKREPERKRPDVPMPNHILCSACHGVARPFVLMSSPGVKDEGFCQAFLQQKLKSYKNWEKQFMEAMKQDSSKGLVILEVGCDKKMDVSRAYSEKTFKTMKQSRCTFVRIAPVSLETKKKGNQETPQNFIALELPVVSALQKIDQLLMQKMAKKA